MSMSQEGFGDIELNERFRFNRGTTAMASMVRVRLKGIIEPTAFSASDNCMPQAPSASSKYIFYDQVQNISTVEL